METKKPAFAEPDFVVGLTAAQVFSVVEDLSTFGALLEDFLSASDSKDESRDEEAEVLSSRLDLAIPFFAGSYLKYASKSSRRLWIVWFFS